MLCVGFPFLFKESFVVDHLSDVDYYTNADDLLSEDDIIETDIRIVGWKKKFRIRALTFAQMEKINKNSEDEKGNMQHDLFVYWTIVEAVVRPKMKIDQVKRLSESNGSFVQELSDEIWKLGRVSKELWDKFIEEANRATKIEKGDMKDEERPKDTN